jgi:hypothetical protein
MLAAASVFLWQTTNRFIWLIGDGVVAVGLFFVLSGFVLARSLMFRNSRHRAWRLAYLGPFTDRAPRTNRIRRSIERTPDLTGSQIASHLISGPQGGEHPLKASERLRRRRGCALFPDASAGGLLNVTTKGCRNATIVPCFRPIC